MVVLQIDGALEEFASLQKESGSLAGELQTIDLQIDELRQFGKVRLQFGSRK